MPVELVFTVGFSHDGKPTMLYCGKSLKAAEFAQAVALESRAYHRIGICIDPVPAIEVHFANGQEIARIVQPG